MRIYNYDFFLKRILECEQEDIVKARICKEKFCTQFTIKKKNGERQIVSLDSGSVLARIQRNLNKNLLTNIPVSPVAKGFVKGMSYVDFLEPHIHNKFFLRLDISNFFDTLPISLVKESLQRYIEDMEILDIIIDLCTYKGRLPQGFITSPVLSNIAFSRIDQRIRRYCRCFAHNEKNKIVYMRYADDMLFSSKDYNFKSNSNFVEMINQILLENHMSLNFRKTIYQTDYLSLSGFVINDDIHLSRKKLHNLNTIIYQFNSVEKYGHQDYCVRIKRDEIKDILNRINEMKLHTSGGKILFFETPQGIIEYLAGYRSFLIQLSRVKHDDTQYGYQISNKICKIEKILEFLSDME